jgi:hypothetical protein
MRSIENFVWSFPGDDMIAIPPNCMYGRLSGLSTAYTGGSPDDGKARQWQFGRDSMDETRMFIKDEAPPFLSSSEFLF